MKKTIYTSNIIKALFVLLILVFVLVKNKQVGIGLMLISFILMILCYLIKNICYLINKPKIANLFHKLYIIIFLAFGASFLIVWSYAVIKAKIYFPLFLTIPFWYCEFYLFRKYILGINSKSTKKRNFNFKIFVSSFLVILVLLMGILCLALGIKDTYFNDKNTKNYLTTTAYFIDYEINEKDDDNSYFLIYEYNVDGQNYTLKTTYSTGFVPDLNSSREIKYNPDDPKEAIFLGTNSNNFLIFYGAFFLFGGLVFVLIYLQGKGVFAKFKIDILGLYIGIIFTIIGFGIFALKLGENLSFLATLKQLGFWSIIPLMFIALGLYQVIKCILKKN